MQRVDVTATHRITGVIAKAIAGGLLTRAQIFVFAALLLNCGWVSLRAQNATDHVSVTGRVLDTDHVPVPYAKVVIRSAQIASATTVRLASSGRITTIADADGVFTATINGRPTILSGWAEVSGYMPCGKPNSVASAVFTAVPADADHVHIEVCVARAAQVAGTVVDSDSGLPIPGLRVAAMSEGFADGNVIFWERARGQSSKEGKFSLKELPPGTYVLHFTGEPSIEFRPEVASAVPIQADQVHESAKGYGRVYWPSMTAEYPGENDTVSITGGAAMSLGAIPLRVQTLSNLRIVPHDFACPAGHRLQALLLNQGDPGLLQVARGEVPCAPFQLANVPRSLENPLSPPSSSWLKDDLVGSRRETKKIKVRADADQSVSRSGLTPGKYHVICLPVALAGAAEQPSVLDRLVLRGQEIELKQGQVLQVDVPVQTP